MRILKYNFYEVMVLLSVFYANMIFPGKVFANCIEVSVNVTENPVIYSDFYNTLNKRLYFPVGGGGLAYMMTDESLARSSSEISAEFSDSSIVHPKFDIKSVMIDRISGGGSIPVRITLMNSSSEDIKIDRVSLFVSKFDGTPRVTYEIRTNDLIVPSKEIVLNYIFPGNQDSGIYLGKVAIYYQNNLLGIGESVINIDPSTPEVLGASTSYFDKYPLPFAAIFLAISVIGTILIFKIQKLKKAVISLGLSDLIGIISLTSAVGSGLFGGYLLIALLDGSSVNNYLPLSAAGLFAAASLLGVIILLKMKFLQKLRTSLDLFDFIAAATLISSIGFGFFCGYVLMGLFY